MNTYTLIVVQLSIVFVQNLNKDKTMITLKIKDLYLCNQKPDNDHQPFLSIFEILFQETKLPILARYNISRIIPEIEKELSIVEKIRIDLIKQYGECIDTDTQQWSIQQGTEEFKLFETTFNDLLDKDIVFQGDKLLLSDFRNTTFNSKQLHLLHWLIVENHYPEDFNEVS